ncbi:MAG: element excision factor XisI family protein [Microcoleaceae cyanobacterium]
MKEILTKYSSHKPSYGEVEVELIFDAGWNRDRRIYGSTIHIDIKDNKLLIHAGWYRRSYCEYFS